MRGSFFHYRLLLLPITSFTRERTYFQKGRWRFTNIDWPWKKFPPIKAEDQNKCPRESVWLIKVFLGLRDAPAIQDIFQKSGLASSPAAKEKSIMLSLFYTEYFPDPRLLFHQPAEYKHSPVPRHMDWPRLRRTFHLSAGRSYPQKYFSEPVNVSKIGLDMDFQAQMLCMWGP